MARIEYRSTPGGTIQRRNGDAWQGVTIIHTGEQVYAAATGSTPYAGALRSDIDGGVPGWLEPGVYTTTNPLSGKSVTFEVGGGANGLEARMDAVESGQANLAPPDTFTRSDRNLNGDTAPDGKVYSGTGSGPPVIRSGRYKTNVVPGTGYLMKVLDRPPDWMSCKFAVVGAVSADAAPTLGLLINKATDGDLTNAVHCIATGVAASIQVLDGTGGAALVNLATNPYPGSWADIDGGTYQLPPGIYTAMIERIGNTVVFTDPLGRSFAHTDARLGSFWGERVDWEIQNNSASRNIEILHTDHGYGRPLRGSGGAHSGRLPLDPITSEAVRAIGGAGNPAFQNSWLNYSSGSAGCGFWRDALGIVHIQGEIKSGVFASGFSTVFTLPSELDASGREIYRPAQRRKFSAVPQGTVISGVFYPWHVEVAVNGDVQVYGTGLAAPALIGLGDITFRPRSLVS